jgi:hypothetical protein
MLSEDYLNIWAKSCVAATLLSGLELRLSRIGHLPPHTQNLFKAAYRQASGLSVTLELLEEKLECREG